MLTEKDLKQIAQRGISEEQIKTQLKQFETGFPFLTASSLPTSRSVSNMSRHGRTTRLLASAW